MPTPFVELIPSSDPAGLPLAGAISQAIEAIRRRAFELFEDRSPEESNEFEDWLRAEREVFEVPAVAVVADWRAGIATVSFEVLGDAARRLTVLVEPRAITLLSLNEQGELTLMRRQNLSEAVDPLRASVRQTESALEVTLIRAQEQPAPKAAAAAASGGFIAAA